MPLPTPPHPERSAPVAVESQSAALPVAQSTAAPITAAAAAAVLSERVPAAGVNPRPSLRRRSRSPSGIAARGGAAKVPDGVLLNTHEVVQELCEKYPPPPPRYKMAYAFVRHDGDTTGGDTGAAKAAASGATATVRGPRRTFD